MSSGRSLGQLLVNLDYITEKELNSAVNMLNKDPSQDFGELLIDQGYIKSEELTKISKLKLDIPYADFSKYILDQKLARYIPEEIARRHKAVPLERVKETLKVAMVNPVDVIAVDDIKNSCNLEIETLIASDENILQAIEQIYALKGTADEIYETLDELNTEGSIEIEVEELQVLIEEAPIIRLANQIITQAVDKRASDIHMEPQDDELEVRYRVDGFLFSEFTFPVKIHPALISRFKIMAELDIAERRRPQDGRMQVRYQGEEIDIRISTLPTINGEKIVLRILKKDNILLSLDNLGFSNHNLSNYSTMINKSHGLILITGPTGSGKSTTLIATLNELNDKKRNITTVEDPVEYKLNGINQVQVNPHTGVIFASTLRSMLRQDPDIIMVGEIRDKETAEISIRAALTGHLVLTTLHTNDAVSTIIRLVDMGIEPYLVASSVVGVVSQRLVRKLCPSCKIKKRISKKYERILEFNSDETYINKVQGCRKCNQTGYLGRTALHEVFVLDEKMRDLISEGNSAEKLRKEAYIRGMKTIKDDGKIKIEEGVTSPEEVIRVAV